MRRLELDKVLNSYGLVQRLWGRIENKKAVKDVVAQDEHGDDFPEIKSQIERLVDQFGELGLRIPKKRANELLVLATNGATYGKLEREIEFLHKCLVDHFEERMVFLIEESRTCFYESQEPLFGIQVFNKFPKSQRDIDDAGKCLALGRNKAAVFHLMLAMEEALRKLASQLDIDLFNKNDQFITCSVLVG